MFVTGDKTLDGYQKKKYVCKLLFIFLLGHDIDFGHMEAVNLLSSNKYTEKQIVSWEGGFIPNPVYTVIVFLNMAYCSTNGQFYHTKVKYQSKNTLMKRHRFLQNY